MNHVKTLNKWEAGLTRTTSYVNLEFCENGISQELEPEVAKALTEVSKSLELCDGEDRVEAAETKEGSEDATESTDNEKDEGGDGTEESDVDNQDVESQDSSTETETEVSIEDQIHAMKHKELMDKLKELELDDDSFLTVKNNAGGRAKLADLLIAELNKAK